MCLIVQGIAAATLGAVALFPRLQSPRRGPNRLGWVLLIAGTFVMVGAMVCQQRQIDADAREAKEQRQRIEHLLEELFSKSAELAMGTAKAPSIPIRPTAGGVIAITKPP